MQCCRLCVEFLRLISEKNYEEALGIARKQVEDGAQIIDINMDDAMLDAKSEMINISKPDCFRAGNIESSYYDRFIQMGSNRVRAKMRAG